MDPNKHKERTVKKRFIAPTAIALAVAAGVGGGAVPGIASAASASGGTLTVWLMTGDTDPAVYNTVNAAFVVYQWSRHLGVTHVRILPDGSGHFTRRMGMLIDKDHLGFGYRSWRYAMVVNDGVIEQWFQEPGINDTGSDEDPYTVTNPETLLAYLRNHPAAAKAA